MMSESPPKRQTSPSYLAMTSWRLLNLELESYKAPPLLTRFDVMATGYTIILTDLIHVWSEDMNHEQINHRALAEGTSVDPSEGPNQLRILLDKLQASLSGESDSRLDLKTSPHHGLVLRITANLPSPLPPLRWAMALSRAPSARLTRELVCPLLVAQIDQAQRLSALERCIKEKDHVIRKLLDAVQSSDIDVASVFLNVQGHMTGKKKLSWDRAGEVIKGLRAFSQDSWRNEGILEEGSHRDVTDLLRQSFSSPFEVSASNLKLLDGALTEDRWWKHLRSSSEARANGSLSMAGRVKRKHKEPEKSAIMHGSNEASNSSDDDFQVGHL